jgi:hypothetical protein
MAGRFYWILPFLWDKKHYSLNFRIFETAPSLYEPMVKKEDAILFYR